MTFALLAVTYRSARRIRLSFESVLGAGAYVAGRYTVENLDAGGHDPGVRAALLVPNSPDVVELALGFDLLPGALYLATATNVPDVGAALSSGALEFRPPGVQPETVASKDDVDALLYGTDLVWDGEDIVEGATGDLATVSGVANVMAALGRAALSSGLPWDSSYGAKAREFVDGAPGSLPELAGRLEAALSQDDRVKRVTVTVEPWANDGNATLTVEGKLIGGQALAFEKSLKGAL